MDTILHIQKTKKLGLLIHSGSSIFGTGILQNAYFLYQCFESLGMKCEFLCHDKDPKPFNYHSLPIKRISMEKDIFDPKHPDAPLVLDEIENVGVSTAGDMVVIRTITDIDDMTFGVGNAYSFKAGVKYRVPATLAAYLEQLGYIWRPN